MVPAQEIIMKIAKFIALLGLVAMTAGLVYGDTSGKFTELALQTSQADWRRFWLGKHA